MTWRWLLSRRFNALGLMAWAVVLAWMGDCWFALAFAWLGGSQFTLADWIQSEKGGE